MKRIEPLTLQASAGATKISQEDALRFFGLDAINAGARHGQMETSGLWSTCHRYTALAVTAEWEDTGYGQRVKTYTLHGDRTMSFPKESGYHLEGHVSIQGTKRSCFTSSTLFELPDGKLVNVAVLYCRGAK